MCPASAAGQNFKKDYLEVGDVVSFDVIVSNDSNGFQIPLATAEFRAGDS